MASRHARLLSGCACRQVSVGPGRCLCFGQTEGVRGPADGKVSGQRGLAARQAIVAECSLVAWVPTDMGRWGTHAFLATESEGGGLVTAALKPVLGRGVVHWPGSVDVSGLSSADDQL